MRRDITRARREAEGRSVRRQSWERAQPPVAFAEVLVHLEAQDVLAQPRQTMVWRVFGDELELASLLHLVERRHSLDEGESTSSVEEAHNPDAKIGHQVPLVRVAAVQDLGDRGVAEDGPQEASSSTAPTGQPIRWRRKYCGN